MIYCSDLDDIQYGSVKLSGKRPTHTAVYTCSKGYKLVGVSKRTCLYSGVWDRKAPICKRKKGYRRTCSALIFYIIFTAIYCPDHLPNPQYGSVTLSGYSPSHTAVYACNKGYKLVGASKRTCLYSGVWDREAPICKRKGN